MKFFFTIVLITLTINSFGQLQAPVIEWQKTLGGSQSDACLYGEPTPDGYILTGITHSNDGDVTGYHGRTDIWVVKLDTARNIQWERALGGSADDQGYCIRQTREGGYVTVGVTISNDGDVTGNHGQIDVWVVKLDANGNIEWQKALGGTHSDDASWICQTRDGGYIIAGQSFSNDGDVSGHHKEKGSILYADCWLIKLDSTGNIEWQKSMGGSMTDIARSVRQTPDNGYIVAGTSYSNDGDVTGHHGDTLSFDYWVIKTDSIGNIEWEKSLGGKSIEASFDVELTNDGNYIVAGYSFSSDGDVTNSKGSQDCWIVKLGRSGNIIWQKCFGGLASEQATFIQPTKDGGYLFTGQSDSYDKDVTGNHGNSYDIWLVKTDSVANIIWEESIGGTDFEDAYSVWETADSGLIIFADAGSTDGDMKGNHGGDDFWIAKLKKHDGTLSIAANPAGPVCPGTSVTFTTKAVNACSPSYQWTINGQPAGHDSTMVTNSLHNNDTITCTMIFNPSCGSRLPIISNSIIIQVAKQPDAGIVSATNDSICPNTLAHLTVTGDTGNIYWQQADSAGAFINTTDTSSSYSSLLTNTSRFRVVANINNCADTSVAKTIVVVPAPVSSFSYIINNLTVNFNSSGSVAATTYSWNFGDSSALSTLPNPSHTYAGPGTYHVCLTVTNKTNCNFTLCRDVTVFPTGINNITGADFFIYPNPVYNNLTVSFPEHGSHCLFDIIDVLGRTIMQKILTEEQTTIDMGSLASGVYYIKVSTANETKTVKVVKE